MFNDGFLLKDTAWTEAITGSVGRTYNSDFNVTELTVNGANPVAFEYDNDQLLVKAGDLNLGRHPQNGLVVSSSLGVVSDNYTYNPFGEASGYTAKGNGDDVFATAYTRDALGRVSQKTETADNISHTEAYTYDAAGRLVEVKRDGTVQATYGYDANGNRTTINGSEIAQYDSQDRLTHYAGISYAYTQNGELKTRTAGSNTVTYDYDVLGNLKKVAPSNGNTIDYVTDGQDRRIGKKVNGTLAKGWLYQDGLRPIAELDGNNQVVARFVYGSKDNVPDYMVKKGNTYRIISDHLGSPRLVIDVATNTAIQEMAYDVWGNVVNDSNPGFQPFGFAGGLYDNDTKLVRFGARDYDAQTGRWTAKDPIQFGGGDTGLYSYVGGNPVNFVDPLGLEKRIFFSPIRDPAAYYASMREPDKSGIFTIYGHGATQGVNGPSFFRRYGEVYDSQAFAEKIRDEGWNGKDPIWLKICRTGEEPEGLAQQLADDLGVTVTAPTTNVWFYDGDVVGPFGKNPDQTINLSDPGRYKQFYPR